MSTFYSDNLNYDIDRYLDEQDEWLRSRPKCSECEEPIQDMECYRFNDKLICENCIDNFKVFVEDLE